ncbi:MAG: hypothetical protein OHK0022_41610 [Roseiflexaceae bacterium]
MPSLVTIVIPCYNHARYLPEAVASVVAQRYPHWEALIVDDGSTDASAHVAQQLVAHYPQQRIRLLRQGNQGLSAARNAGLAEAAGEYLLPLDADDRIAPELLEQAVAVLDQQPEVGFVYTDVLMFGEETTRWSGGAYSLTKLRFDCPMVPATLFRTAPARLVGGFRAEMRQGYEDWDFWLRLAGAGWQGYHLPLPLVHYRRSGGSMLAGARRRDMRLRAQVIRNNAALYEPGLVAWARRMATEPEAAAGGWRDMRDFLGYAAQIARYHPRLLPKTLARPLFIRLSARQQGYARRLARLLRLTQSAARF